MTKERKYPSFVKQVEGFPFEDPELRNNLKVSFEGGEDRYLTVIMKNPSKANSDESDPTVNKLCKAAYNVGYGGIVIVNLFPYRSPNAVAVYDCYIKTGMFLKNMDKNNEEIRNACEGQDVLLAWGTNTIKKNKDFQGVYDGIIDTVVDIVTKCANAVLGNGGHDSRYPRHPLFCRNKDLEDLLKHLKDMNSQEGRC